MTHYTNFLNEEDLLDECEYNTDGEDINELLSDEIMLTLDEIKEDVKSDPLHYKFDLINYTEFYKFITEDGFVNPIYLKAHLKK